MIYETDTNCAGVFDTTWVQRSAGVPRTSTTSTAVFGTNDFVGTFVDFNIIVLGRWFLRWGPTVTGSLDQIGCLLRRRLGSARISRRHFGDDVHGCSIAWGLSLMSVRFREHHCSRGSGPGLHRDLPSTANLRHGRDPPEHLNSPERSGSPDGRRHLPRAAMQLPVCTSGSGHRVAGCRSSRPTSRHLIFDGTLSRWLPPWNMPWGQLKNATDAGRPSTPRHRYWSPTGVRDARRSRLLGRLRHAARVTANDTPGTSAAMDRWWSAGSDVIGLPRTYPLTTAANASESFNSAMRSTAPAAPTRAVQHQSSHGHGEHDLTITSVNIAVRDLVR